MIMVLKTSHHGPSDAMHNPSQLLRLVSKEVCFISHGDQHASIGFLIPRSLILKRVILFRIHSDDGNPSRANIKQLCSRYPPINNQLRTSSNSRTQANIQDGRIVVQDIQEKVDVYDSELDDASTASAIFMVKLSPAGSINRDEVGTSYDSYILSEVPNYDTYHVNDMFNHFVHEFPASEQLVSVNDMYMDFLSDNNVIFENPYPDNNEKEVLEN
ncbi:hypothetical protein Tco_1346672 [Tanacetum coccineum]